MISNKLIERAAKDSINKIGMAYRLNLLYISYSTGENSEDNHIDIKIYDSTIKQVCNVRIENIDTPETNSSNVDTSEIDSMSASILEDYPEATLRLDDNVSNNLNNMLKSTHVSLNGDENMIRKVYDIEIEDDSDGDIPILSDINQLSYESLCIIMTDIFKSMMSVTIFSVN